MGKGFSKKKKQARMMQEQLTKFQQEMEKTEVTGSAGNGLVVLSLNGNQEMTAIKIKPECVDPEDVEGLEDLIKAAYKDASKQLADKNPMMGQGSPDMPFGGGLPDLSGFGL